MQVRLEHLPAVTPLGRVKLAKRRWRSSSRPIRNNVDPELPLDRGKLASAVFYLSGHER